MELETASRAAQKMAVALLGAVLAGCAQAAPGGMDTRDPNARAVQTSVSELAATDGGVDGGGAEATSSTPIATSAHNLTPLSADRIDPVAAPIEGGASFVDPAYGTRIYRATAADDGAGGRMRHEYSRRQAFNANNSRYLAQDDTGHWFLYDAATFRLLTPLPQLAGDCEPLWDPADPDRLYFTAANGGSAWWSLDVHSGRQQLVFDFTGQTPWPEASSFWTKGEGGLSADGRHLALLASRYDQANKRNVAFGLVSLDLVERKIVGVLDAADFPVPGAIPDHVSTAASGRYVVPSWLEQDGGTWAYSVDFSERRQLTRGSEHSDLAIGPGGEDLLVYADYASGHIRSVDLADGNSTELHPLYPAPGEAYALHISGQGFERPGWVVVSTYADSADYGATVPAPRLRAEYRKVWLLELKPGGRALNVAHVRSQPLPDEPDEAEAYFLEPQASPSRDLSRIIYASNVAGRVESYVVVLPPGWDETR